MRTHALGKRLLTLGAGRDAQGRIRWQTIVGVVKDVSYRELAIPRFDIYVPSSQAPIPAKDVVIRTAATLADPLSVATAVEHEIRTLNSQSLISAPHTLTHIVSRATAPWRFNMLVFSLFALLAIVLSAGGLFGLVSHGVARRTRELGLRVALGARRRDLLALVLGQAVGWTMAGIGTGAIAAFAVARYAARMLFGVPATDAVSFATVSLLLGIVALAASALGARRAVIVDPARTLKAD